VKPCRICGETFLVDGEPMCNCGSTIVVLPSGIAVARALDDPQQIAWDKKQAALRERNERLEAAGIHADGTITFSPKVAELFRELTMHGEMNKPHFWTQDCHNRAWNELRRAWSEQIGMELETYS
jgi:hypothetical protein